MTMEPTEALPPSPDTPGVIAPPPIVFAVGFGVAMLLNWCHGLPIPFYPVGLDWPGLTLMNASLVLALWAAFYMNRARTHINPMLPTSQLVTGGPYRFSRNPLSVSLLLLYVGCSLRLDTFWPLLLLAPLLVVFHFGVIQREERYLERKFGESYRDYCAKVRRWI
jgi:protein-S-isoprenylcysteine O-methyltransferase Ste14